MANITPTVTVLQSYTPWDGWKVQWLTMLNGDIGVGQAGTAGTGISISNSSDRSIQVEGTFGAGGTVKLEGSNDGTNWEVLTDPQGVAISFAAAGIKQVTEATIFVRSHVTAGDGTTSVNVTMFFRTTIRP